MNEIVKLHNDFIELPLKDFNSSEIDILSAICYKVQDKGESVTLNLSDIRDLSDYKSKDDKRFFDALGKTVNKLNSLNFRVGEDREYVQFTLFPKFRVSEISGTVDITVSDDFKYLLNKITGNYTMLEVQQSVSLSSRYAKQIYKMLRRFKNTGVWIVNMEEFKEYLDVPKGFSISKIDERIINTSLNELGYIFKNLKCEKLYEKNGRGRPKVTGYKFTFKPENTKKDLPPIEKIAGLGEWKKTKLCCPNCRERIYKKEMSNEHGNYYLYGHPDFRTGKCNWTTTNATDCLTVDRVENEKMIDALSKNITDEERRENKNRLSQMLSKMFK